MIKVSEFNTNDLIRLMITITTMLGFLTLMLIILIVAIRNPQLLTNIFGEISLDKAAGLSVILFFIYQVIRLVLSSSKGKKND
jgi:hypothetical protein